MREEDRSHPAELEESLPVLLDTMVDGLLVVDGNGIVRYANPSARAFFAGKTTNLLGFHLGLPLGQDPVDMVLPSPGERGRIVEMRAAEISWAEGRGSLVSLRDVTQNRTDREELEQLNRELEARVASRTAQLEMANQELEAFSYSVSHDLQAPLRRIAGFSAALQEDFCDELPEEAQKHLERITSGVHRMSTLMQALLDLSRITRRDLHLQPLNLSDLARAVVRDSEEAIGPGEATEIRDTPQTWGDRILLHQVLENLLRNAWKFSRGAKDPSVEFGAMEEDGVTVYFVRDNGVGFDPAYAKKLFAPFARLHSEMEFPGTGIGLSIAFRILKRHGGDIWFESAPNQGATFFFTVDQPRPPLSGSGPGAGRGLDPERKANAQSPPPASGPTNPPKDGSE